MSKESTSDELSFWGHLDALRFVLIRLILVWLTLAIGFFIAMPVLFDKVVLAPCQDDFVFYTFLKCIGAVLQLNDDFFTREFHVSLVNINLAAPFFIHISTALWMSVVITVPYLLFEVWWFITPALYEKERKGIAKGLGLGVVLFFLGILAGYYMVYPLTLRFLSTYQLSNNIVNQLSLNSYIDNFMALILCLGLAFELPLVAWILSLFGIIDRNFLRKYRRHAFTVIVIVAAVITPTGDPFTLAAVSLPLYLLYELSIIMVKVKTT